MKTTHVVLASAAALLLSACASTGGEQAATPRGVETKSVDGTFTGEVIGKAAPGSGFAKLRIGMTPAQVQEIMDGAPDRNHSFESGKRWIPFYYGNDSQRLQVLYRREGCLTFTGGNVFGGGGNELVRITATPREDCLS
ncbi:MAG TPA: hypothetical protein VLK29_04990 [Luteimonas sp.]|nr:hypothetical protein [Luteimonas sp.]